MNQDNTVSMDTKKCAEIVEFCIMVDDTKGG